MNIIQNIHKYSLYLFAIALSFERVDLFSLGVDFLATKIAIVIVLLTFLFNYKQLKYDRRHNYIIMSIVMYFMFFTLVNYINVSSLSTEYFDFLTFVSIIVFLLFGATKNISDREQIKRLVVYAMGNILLLILYYLGIGAGEYAGRATIFFANQNILGIGFTFTFFILLSLVYEKKLFVAKVRYILIVLLPPILMFITSTGSRVSLISIFVGLGVYTIFKKTVNRSFKKVIFVILAVVGSYILWDTTLENTIGGQRLLESIIYGDSAYRDKIWDIRYSEILNNPFIGVGKTGYLDMHPNQSPHNVFLEVYFYTGMVGFLIFVTFYGLIIKNALLRLKQENYLLPLLLLIPVTGMLVSGQLFEHKYMWFILSYVAFPGGLRSGRKMNNMSNN